VARESVEVETVQRATLDGDGEEVVTRWIDKLEAYGMMIPPKRKALADKGLWCYKCKIIFSKERGTCPVCKAIEWKDGLSIKYIETNNVCAVDMAVPDQPLDLGDGRFLTFEKWSVILHAGEPVRVEFVGMIGREDKGKDEDEDENGKYDAPPERSEAFESGDACE